MNTTDGGAPKATGTRLEELFGGISRLISEGRHDAALRLADCARRIAPEDSNCLLVYGRLLIRLGAMAEAAELLRDCQNPDCQLTYAEGLAGQGLWDEAASICQGLLARFALDSLESLPAVVTQLCSARINK